MKKKSNCFVIVPLIFLSFFLIIACTNEPQPINYGHDACSFCEMNIVNQSFAAQAVSTKGKQFKYDSVECLVNHLGQEDLEMESVWVSDYQHPGVMIEVGKAYFIINDSLKSPMGANLAALRHDRQNSLSWRELQIKLLGKSFGHSSPKSSEDIIEESSHHK